MERVTFTELKKRISWGSIIAGVITVIAISILLSILGTSIGLFMVDPTSSEPVSGVGTTIGIWTVVSLLISLAAGGFVAGKLAGADGIIHGFLVWATSLIMSIILAVFLTIGAVKFTANVLGSVASVTGDVLSGVGSAVGGGVSALSDQAKDLFNDIDFDDRSDRNDVQKDVREALKKSGVKEFQPEYLQGQFKAVRKDLKASVRKVVANPDNADNIINDFTERLKNRAEKMTQNIDRNDLTKAIANNSNLSKAEVERAVDQYLDITNNAIEEGKEKINDLQESIASARQDLEEMKQQALVEADKASNAAARSALISFFGILIGGVLCSFAGMFGMRKTQERYEV